jgi:cyclopropane fatty-acyl-phospholipid synthase-like methyltransferase
MIGDKSIDLVFSWDSFVHMHKNVVESYFSEISRVIKDDGKILIHHANFSGGYDLSFKNWHGRANLTHQEFLTICKKYSIKIINQRPIVMKTENSSVTDMISLCGK